MPIIGTNFTKINVERTGVARNVKINSNLGIKDISDLDLSLGKSKQVGVKFEFEFTVKYDPGASMLFEGEVLYLGEEKDIAEIKKQWADKKPVEEKLMADVMNSALQKSTIKALELSSDLGLPAPIKLPKVTQKEK
jgi:hypothetical protein